MGVKFKNGIIIPSKGSSITEISKTTLRQTEFKIENTASNANGYGTANKGVKITNSRLPTVISLAPGGSIGGIKITLGSTGATAATAKITATLYIYNSNPESSKEVLSIEKQDINITVNARYLRHH